MKSTYATLMQSRFFTPAFNSALFDGPIRIYFSQFHESLALKIYFGLQQGFAKEMDRAKDYHRILGKNILIMLYPNQDSFSLSFEGQDDWLVNDHLDEDHVLGLNGPFEDEKLEEVLAAIITNVLSWEKEIEELEQTPEMLA